MNPKNKQDKTSRIPEFLYKVVLQCATTDSVTGLTSIRVALYYQIQNPAA